MRGALAALALAGCSYTFGGVGEDVRLVGEPPDLSAEPRARQLSSQARHLMFDSRGTPWVVLRDLDLTGLTDVQEVQLVPPLDVQSQAGVFLNFGKKRYYGLDERTETSSRVTVHSVGVRSADLFMVASGPGAVAMSESDVAFLWVPNKNGAMLTLGRIVPRRQRELAREDLWQSGTPPGPTFDRDGDRLFVYDSDGTVSTRNTVGEPDVTLGRWRPPPALTPAFALRNAEGALVVCMPSGIELRAFDGVTVTPVVGEPCRADAPFSVDVEFAYYVSGERVRSVRLDGSDSRDLGPFVDGRRFAALAGGHAVMSEESSGAAAAWIGERQIAERARSISFSRDGRKVRYLEHAATTPGVGELYSLRLEGGEPELLGRNVKRFAELPDGRVMAAVNQAYVGPHNRVVVIDEVARTAAWVAAAAKDFELFPDGSRALVGLLPSLVGNATDWVVVTVPTR